MKPRKSLCSILYAVTVVFLIGCEVQDDEVTAGENPNGVLSILKTYEAENHTFQTGCTKSTAYSGYSGTGFMDFGGNTTLVEWGSVNAPSAGQYTLSFRYANGRGSDRQCSMLINDTTNAGLVSFSPTGSWMTWSTATIKVNLKAGSNKIRVTANTDAGGPNLDKMDVMSESSASGTCALVSEGQTANLLCPSGQVVNTITFASYGTPAGSCPSFSSSSCHASSSKSVVESACLNKQSCTVGANNGVFGDPCGGVPKKLAVVYTCSGSADACPNDPNKTSPGICGCGTSDTDSDGDGTANCKDGCQTDPKKTAPGQCGCGVPEGSCNSASKCVEAAESGTATLSCPSGQVIDAIRFASFGTPTGSCPNFSNGSCHASSSMATVKSLCLNKQSCSVGANNGVFGDPCAGVGKKLAVAYTCGAGTINPGAIMPVFLLAGQSNMVGNVDKSCFDGLMYELGQGPATNLQQRLTNRLLSWYQSNDGYAMYGYSEQIAAYETSELIRLNNAGLVNATLSEPYSKVLCAYQNASPQPLALNCGGPFGLELVLGHALGNAAYSPTSLIKVAKGGTSLYVDWLPPSAAKRNGRSVGPFYTELSQRIQSLKTNPTSVHPNCASQNCRWAGFIWFQGENDVFDAAYGQEYAQNLKNFISDVRSEIGSPALPVIIVEIGAWAQSCDSGKNVAPAQQAFVAADPYAKLVKTDDLSGFYHYDPAAQLIIGERVAKALVPMLK